MTIAGLLVLAGLTASCSTASSTASRPAPPDPVKAATVWLCRPGMADDPCTGSLATTKVTASGATSVARPVVASDASRFDCFYVHPRVGPDPSAQVEVATGQAARFSQVCRVWAPAFVESPTPGPRGIRVGDSSVQAAFEDYLAHDNDGRPIIVIGHSEGAATLIYTLSRLVDGNASLRGRVVLAILLGGSVEVPDGRVIGGTFRHIPLCTSPGETGCVIAYSSFPGLPPLDSMFGRPGQGMSLTTGQPATSGVEVACVNPAAIGGGGTAGLSPIFPADPPGPPAGNVDQETAFTPPWVTYPGLYTATCKHGDGATWLQVTKVTGSSDQRPTVTEPLGPASGYHPDDVNLALGDLVADVAAAESTWSRRG